ncbi:MAG: HD domain-containing phosphohydrolase [Phycisphaerales bacterium]|jgi:HD-GYP domain-containing protein (c-di-GMP phosphodiesterase class II)
MLRVTIANARPGMVLAESVHHPSAPQTILLRKGVTLDQHAIPKLSELGVHELWIDYPGLEDLVKFVDPRVLASYREITHHIGSAIDSAFVQSSVDLDFFVYRRAIMGLLVQLANNPSAALFVTELAGADRPFVRHCGNLCALSLLMGLKLDFYLVRERGRLSSFAARDISGLGVGAMFADMGMTRLSEEALRRYNLRLDEKDPEWRSHTQLGYEMLREQLDPASAAVILNHHQHFDGTGYPGRTHATGSMVPVVGSEIHIFTRIVTCADTFDRLRHAAHAPKSSERVSPSIPTVRALKQMINGPFRAWLDPLVFKALVSVAPPYPPGSIVTITGGRTAAVVGWSPEDPCRPTVQIIERPDEFARSKPPTEKIDLRTAPELQITEIDGYDVSEDNFAPSEPHEFDVGYAGRTMFNRAHSDLRTA